MLEIESVGKYNVLPHALNGPASSLKDVIETVIYSHEAETLVFKSSRSGGLLFAGYVERDAVKDFMFGLAEMHGSTGLMLSHAIPVGDGTDNIAGIVRVSKKTRVTSQDSSPGRFMPMDMEDFKACSFSNVFLDQHLNVIIEENETYRYIDGSNFTNLKYEYCREHYLPTLISNPSLASTTVKGITQLDKGLFSMEE